VARLLTASALLLYLSAPCVGDPVLLPAADDSALVLASDTGRVEAVEIAGERLEATGGFRLEDAVTGETAEPAGVMTGTEEGADWVGEAADLGLRVEARFRPLEEALEVGASLRDTTGEDRAVRLSFALGVDAVGWRWWDDMRRSQAIVDGNAYGGGRQHSDYPLCCIEDGRRALSMAIPLDPFVTHRLQYDAAARELRLTFDLGLSPAAEKFPSRAEVRFFIFFPDPEWGFRSAAERYYRMHPEPFTTHASTRGLWMTFHDLAEIPLAEDFHFGFHENGKNPAINRRLGVATLHYVMPGQIDVLLPFDAPRKQSFDEVEAWVRENAPREEVRDRWLERVQIMRECALERDDGELSYHTFYANWARGRLVYDCFVNSDPDLPVEHQHAAYMERALDAVDAQLEADGLDLDGVYLDNFGGGQPNFRREHFASVDHPLTFRGDPPRPCTLAGIGEHEYAQHLGDKHRPERHIVFANGWRRPQIFHSAVLDAGGTETYWATRQSRLGPQWDWCRVLMQGKVHCPLLKFDKDEINALFSHLEDYLAEATFYGFYPSIYTSGGWKHQSFWLDPGMYERYREQFRLYVPVVDLLQEAGWQPVTRARLSDERLGIERYGAPADGVFYLTLYNPLDQAQTVAIESNLRCESEDAVAVDLLHPDVWHGLPEGRAQFDTTVRSGECRAFLICGREEATRRLWERGMEALELTIEDPVVGPGLADLRASLGDITPDSENALLHEALKPLHEMAFRDTGFHDAGERHYIALRARECGVHLSAAIALDRGMHLGDALPMVDALPAGVAPTANRPGESWHGPATLLGRGDSGLPGPHERATFAALSAPDEPDLVGLMVRRSYRVTWPVALETAETADGAIVVRATNLTDEMIEGRVSAQAPEGFRVSPAQTDLRIEPGATETVRYEVTGPEGFAGEAGTTWRVERDGEPLGWAGRAVAWMEPDLNMVEKGDFEDWDGPPEGASLGGDAEVVAEGARAGAACLRTHADSAAEEHLCRWSLEVDGAPPESVLVSGWSRAEDVSGEPDKHYSIWVGARTVDDGWAHIGTVNFDTGTHDWQRRTAVFEVPRDVNLLNIWALFRGHAGTAWFDDVYVAPATGIRGHNLALDAEVVSEAPRAGVIADGEAGADAHALHLDANPEGHSLELRWPRPIQVSRAVLRWPQGERRPLSSTEFALQYHDGRGWTYWAVGHTYVPEQPSVLEAPPVVTDRLRFVQAPKGGPIDARDELHISEIEVY